MVNGIIRACMHDWGWETPKFGTSIVSFVSKCVTIADSRLSALLPAIELPPSLPGSVSGLDCVGGGFVCHMSH